MHTAAAAPPNPAIQPGCRANAAAASATARSAAPASSSSIVIVMNAALRTIAGASLSPASELSSWISVTAP